MGYTHYMRQSGDLEPGWDAFTEDVRGVIDEASRGDIGVAGADGYDAAAVGDDAIILNGRRFPTIDGEYGDYEALVIDRRSDRVRRSSRGDRFSFCKTARLPYDVVVVAVYAIVSERWPEAVEVSSDGHPHEWAAGVELARRATGREVPCPPGITAQPRCGECRGDAEGATRATDAPAA